MALTVWEKMSHIDISWSQPSPARSGGQFAHDFHTLTAAPPVLYPHFFSKWGLQIWRPVVFNTINFTVYIWLTIWIQWGVDTYESTRGWVHFLYTVYDFTIFFLHILICYLYQNNYDKERERTFILIRLISVKCRCVCSEKKTCISEITLIVCPKIILSSLLCFGFPSWEITDIHKNMF